MTETNRFEHDRSPYERPTFPFRCGREAVFGRPCPRGPTAGGECQGMADCAPFQTRKVVTDSETGEEREILRWECRRPAWAGGPCAEGPKPDGACSCTHPPCAPRATIRRKRGRWALIAVAAIVSLAVGLAGLGGGNLASVPGLPSSLDPGELSGKHAQFTAADGCTSCHAGHSETMVGWASALFESQPISEACVSCHAFGEGDTSPDKPSPLVFQSHNMTFPGLDEQPTAACTSCHTEHLGEHASIVVVTDGQCAACHEGKFVEFAGSHPPFSPNFPHESARTIKFPHGKHFDQHFQDARYADKAPENCQTCHYDQADGRLLPGGFEVGCQGCHEQAIKEKGFAVIGFPELSDPTLTQDAADVCGFANAQIDPTKSLIEALAETLPAIDSLTEAVDGADYSAVAAAAETLAEQQETLVASQEEIAEAIDPDPVSLETPLPVQAYLLGVDAEDVDAYSEPMADFMSRTVEEARAPLVEAIEERGGDPAAMLAGLTAEMVTRVTCAWVANAEYEPVEYAEPGQGWAAEEYQVSYMPTGHADPVVRSWIGFALASRGSDDLGADVFRDAILTEEEGPGRCFKCHVAPEGDGPAKVSWAIPREDVRPLTTFDHRPHLNVLEAGLGCATCHRSIAKDEQLADSQKRPGPFANEFKPIEASTCAECHHDGGVRQDCSLCHKYHTDPSIRKRTM